MKIGEIWIDKQHPKTRIRLFKYHPETDIYVVEGETDREHKGFETWYRYEMSRLQIIDNYIKEN
jgi:hypothetical protein